VYPLEASFVALEDFFDIFSIGGTAEEDEDEDSLLELVLDFPEDEFPLLLELEFSDFEDLLLGLDLSEDDDSLLALEDSEGEYPFFPPEYPFFPPEDPLPLGLDFPEGEDLPLGLDFPEGDDLLLGPEGPEGDDLLLGPEGPEGEYPFFPPSCPLLTYLVDLALFSLFDALLPFPPL
jgi:hypothetical protein